MLYLSIYQLMSFGSYSSQSEQQILISTNLTENHWHSGLPLSPDSRLPTRTDTTIR